MCWYFDFLSLFIVLTEEKGFTKNIWSITVLLHLYFNDHQLSIPLFTFSLIFLFFCTHSFLGAINDILPAQVIIENMMTLAIETIRSIEGKLLRTSKL